MPIGMKRSTEAILFVPTASGSLTEVGSGNSAAGNVAVDLFEGDGTGYSNFFTEYTIPVQFSPGVAKRYDLALQGYRFLGECSVKIDTKYEDLVDSGSHLQIGSVLWNYQRLTERGAGFGNDRLVLALTRRKSA